MTKEELKRIKETELPHDYLRNARNWLLISCQTGQRVSDFMRFKKEMIHYRNGIPEIEFEQVKTSKKMSIPLNQEVMDILNSNNGEFPRSISDVKYNEYIKEVCQIAGIDTPTKGTLINPDTKRKEKGVYPKWKLITSHAGRRSFATNYFGEIPTPLLAFATGHSTEQMFLHYIGKTESDKSKQLGSV